MVPRWIARRWIEADDPHPRANSGCDGFAEPGGSGLDRLPEPVAIVNAGGRDSDRPSKRACVSVVGPVTDGLDAPAHDRVLFPAGVGAPGERQRPLGHVAISRRAFICHPLELDSCSGQSVLDADRRTSSIRFGSVMWSYVAFVHQWGLYWQ